MAVAVANERRKGMTKTDRALEYLKTHRGMTTYDAFIEHGNTRLSDTIYRLRRKGYKILSVNLDVTDRYGDACRISEYRLVG